MSIYSGERRAFLKRICQAALLAAGGVLFTGCGGSGSDTSGGALTPGGTARTRYRVERLFGDTPDGRNASARNGDGRGRTSPPPPWYEARNGRFGRINSRSDVLALNPLWGPYVATLYRGGGFVETAVPAPPSEYFTGERPLDMNDSGQLLVYQSGYRYTGGPYEETEDLPTRLFLCADGTARQIELPYGTVQSQAGLNNSGHVAGRVFVEEERDATGTLLAPFYSRAFVWRDGQPVQFGPRDCEVYDINDAGQVLLSTYSSGVSSRYVLWQGTDSIIELNLTTSDGLPRATLNQEGAVLASSGDGNEIKTHLWTPDRANGSQGAAVTVAGLPMGFRSEDMNIRRDFVGSAGDPTQPTGSYGESHRAYLMRSGASEADDLNALIPADSGVFLERAYGINDMGQITCVGRTDPENLYSAHAVYLLTPDGTA